jgi:hypothetical protein
LSQDPEQAPRSGSAESIFVSDFTRTLAVAQRLLVHARLAALENAREFRQQIAQFRIGDA